jgi:hypothetical protein
MQKSMIVFMAMSFSLAYMPNSFGMEPNRPSTNDRRATATLQTEIQNLRTEIQNLRSENQELKEEYNRFVGFYKNHDTAVKRSFYVVTGLLSLVYFLNWLSSGVSNHSSNS